MIDRWSVGTVKEATGLEGALTTTHWQALCEFSLELAGKCIDDEDKGWFLWSIHDRLD
jgi:hypothetical protein